MKIVSLQAQNVKKLRAVQITPDGSVVQITGRNGSGKTSVLDAIYWALAGASVHGSKPVREGEEKALVRLDLGDVVIIRRFTAGGGTSLVVEAANGAVFRSPQTVLDQLLGKLAFDPLEFSRMGRKEQLETLRGMVELDIDLDALDAASKADYEARTDVNRAVKSAESRLAQLDAVLIPQMDTTPVDVSTLLEQMEQASSHNAAVERAAEAEVRWGREADAMEEEAEDLEAQAAKMLERAKTLQAQAETLREKIDESARTNRQRINVAALREQIEVAQRENAAKADEHRRRQERHAAANEVMRLQAQAQGLTAAIDARQKQKADAIAAAKMPIDGLGFGEGEVLYNGVPFEQASSAEQLRVSVALAMAANPKLRVLRIKDGSLLDMQGLTMLRDMADAHDYQVWIETVDENASVGIHMEDGAVAAVNGSPVPSDDEPVAEMAVAS